MAAEERMPHLRSSPPRDAGHGSVFHIWGIRGRKRLLHTGVDLNFCADSGAERWYASLSPNLESGTTCLITMPQESDQVAHKRLLQQLVGGALSGRVLSITRVDLLHMRCLQALDALQAGCRQPEVAIAIFGVQAVAEHWHADSELRAQVRHIIARSKAFLAGGYLQLAGLRCG
jgi:hypothetical protein